MSFSDPERPLNSSAPHPQSSLAAAVRHLDASGDTLDVRFPAARVTSSEPTFATASVPDRARHGCEDGSAL